MKVWMNKEECYPVYFPELKPDILDIDIEDSFITLTKTQYDRYVKAEKAWERIQVMLDKKYRDKFGE